MRNERIKSMIPAQPGWAAVIASTDPEGFYKNPIVCWALVVGEADGFHYEEIVAMIHEGDSHCLEKASDHPYFVNIDYPGHPFSDDEWRAGAEEAIKSHQEEMARRRAQSASA